MKRISLSFFIAALVLVIQDTAVGRGCDYLDGFEKEGSIVCGKVKVPENHDKPGGRKISISYVVVQSTAAAADRQSPLVFFTGGPGGRTINTGFVRFFFRAKIRNSRDIVFFDQRGIGRSSALPDIGKGIYNAMAADTDLAGERTIVKRVLDEYRKRAKAAGIELGDYNSFQNARDAAAVMEELGYHKYNLFGVSYGTRLARLIQDLYPGRVEAVILDSPNPMSDDFLIDRIKGYSSSAEKIFKFCESDEGCAARFPGLRRDYIEVINLLKGKPITLVVEGEAFHLNSQDAIYFLRRQLYRSGAKKEFPEFVAALKNRDVEIISRAVKAERDLVIGGGFNTSMFLAVSGYESMDTANTKERIDRYYSETPHFPDGLAFFTSLYLEGMNWHSKTLPAANRNFSLSSVPTMIFVNRYDPVTPPENGKHFMKKLTNGRLYILDAEGHGGNFGCKMEVIMSYLEDSAKSPNAACLKIFQQSVTSAKQ